MFLNAIMLAGIGGAVLPLVLHFMARARYRRVAWGAMMFLEQAEARQMSSSKVRQWLLLLLRMLLVALLAVALARPLSRGGLAALSQGQRVTAVIVLDVSPSMAYPDRSDRDRLDLAKEAATSVLTQLRRGDQAALVLVGAPTPAGNVAPTADLQEIASRVASLQPMAGRSNLAEGLRQANDLLSQQPGNAGEIYLITDRQASGWEDLAQYTPPVQQPGGPHHPVRLFSLVVGSNESDNVAVEKLELLDPPAVRNQPVDVEVTVHNYGQSARTDVPLTLLAGQKQLAQTAVYLPPGASTTLRQKVKFNAVGSTVLTAKITGGGLPLDDQQQRSIDVVDPLPVLVITGDPGTGRRAERDRADPERSARDRADRDRARRAGNESGVGGGGNDANDANALPGRDVRPPDFTGEADYLRLALAPYASAGRRGPDPAVVDVTDDAHWPDDLTDKTARVIVLANVGQIDARQVRQIEQFVFGGGGLLIAPGNRWSPQRYDELFFRDGAGLLPAAVKRIVEPAVVSDADRLLGIETGHPIFRFLQGRTDPAAAISVLRHLSFGRIPSETTSLASLQSGDPLLLVRSFGRGRVALLGVAIDADWSNLPWSKLYLPLMQSTIKYLAGGEAQRRNIAPGQPIEATLQIDDDTRAFILRPDGRTTRVELAHNGATASIIYTDTDLPGRYVLRVQKQPPVDFIVSSPLSESDLTQIDDEAYDGICKRLEMRQLGPDRREMASVVGVSREGVEVSLLALSAVALLAGGESVVSQRWSRQREPAARGVPVG